MKKMDLTKRMKGLKWKEKTEKKEKYYEKEKTENGGKKVQIGTISYLGGGVCHSFRFESDWTFHYLQNSFNEFVEEN